MSEEKTSKIGAAIKDIHRRMSSMGKSSKSHRSPYENYKALPSVADTHQSSSRNSLAEYLLSNDPDHGHDERDTRLFSIDKLEIPDRHRKWFESINMAVHNTLKSEQYDVSHDYEHIQRVVMNANRLWRAEHHREEFHNVDPVVIYVAAMVHGIGNEKYRGDKAGNEAVEECDEVKQDCQRDTIELFIKKAAPACPSYIWDPASHIASLISFSREIHDSQNVLDKCKAYPALQIVQDAERLDALGALGIARACVDGGTQQPRGSGSIRRVVEMVDEHLARYPGLMKTREGKREAEKKWAVMERIRDEMVEEAGCEDVLEAYQVFKH
jgi:uncharacterized protein